MATCPHCGKNSSDVTGKPFKNVMNRYVNKSGQKATFNEAANPFTDEKGVVWQIGSVWNDSTPTPPIKPLTPVPGLGAPKVPKTTTSA